MRERYPEVGALIWFGSWVRGLPSPGSDVDLCLVLDDNDIPMRDRVSRYLPERFPVGIDLFVYIHQEFEALASTSPGWERTMRAGILF